MFPDIVTGSIPRYDGWAAPTLTITNAAAIAIAKMAADFFTEPLPISLSPTLKRRHFTPM
jgi:hypothetical protein